MTGNDDHLDEIEDYTGSDPLTLAAHHDWLLAELRDARAEIAALRLANETLDRSAEDARAEIERLRKLQFLPLGDNHHNAGVCPYCTATVAAERDEARAELAAERAKVEELRRILTPTADDLAALGKVVALAESATDAEGIDYATPLAAALSERQALRATVGRIKAALDMLASDTPSEMLVLPPEHHACEREITRLVVLALRRALTGGEQVAEGRES